MPSRLSQHGAQPTPCPAAIPIGAKGGLVTMVNFLGAGEVVWQTLVNVNAIKAAVHKLKEIN